MTSFAFSLVLGYLAWQIIGPIIEALLVPFFTAAIKTVYYARKLGEPTNKPVKTATTMLSKGSSVVNGQVTKGSK